MAAKRVGDINFCPSCGLKVDHELVYHKLRPVCQSCSWIYFEDPKVAVAAIIVQGGSVLLVRRKMQPGKGKWMLPAGFVDAGEELREALKRECLEEINAEIVNLSLVDVISGKEHPGGADILICYSADLASDVLAAGDDVDRVGFFKLDQLPPLAFSSTEEILNKNDAD